MSRIKVILAAIAFSAFAATSRGGSVITTNLPSNTAIINIDGRADGAASYTFDSPGDFQTRWYQPFNTSGNLLEYTVQPGTYKLRVIDPADAKALYPSLTSTQASQIYTAWTYNSPWITNYLVFDDSAKNNSAESQLIYGAIGYDPNRGGLNFPNATAAYQAAITGNGGTLTPWYNEFFAGEAFHSPLVTQYTFTSPETLIFAVPDYFLPDNNGGVSVLITPAVSSVPEPAGLALASVVLIGAGARALRRRRVASID
jgi:hypothetical protein